VYLGVTNSGLFGTPDYSDGELAFTGYWRKAFENRPALGIGLQASEEVQNLTGQTQVILKNGARARLDLSVSNSDYGQGYAYALNYNLTVRSEEHTSELQSRENLVCRLLL